MGFRLWSALTVAALVLPGLTLAQRDLSTAICATASETLSGEGKASPHHLQLQQLVQVGRDAPDTIGFHGTSLEALRYAETHGHLPSGFVEGNQSIYFMPINGRVPGAPEVEKSRNAGVAFAEARGYAGELARRHAFMAELKLDLGNSELQDWAHRYLATDREINGSREYFKKLGFKRAQLEAAEKIARTRKGLVIAIGPEAAKRFPIKPGDGPAHAPDDLRIETGTEGLPISTFVGVDPIGDYEDSYFTE